MEKTKSLNKLQEIFSKVKMRDVIFCLVVFICTILYYYNLVYKFGEEGHTKAKILFLVIAIVGSIILYGVIRLIQKFKENKLHITFAIIATVLGLAYLFLAPMFTGSDEQIHFYRIYEIADGKMITPITSEGVGSELPKSLKSAFIKPNDQIKYIDIKDMAQIQLNKEDTEFYKDEYPSAALYIPIQYLPHVVGVSIGKLLNLGPYFLGMLGRLFNFIFYIAICTIGIKLLPKHKLFAMTILLTPAILSTAAPLSTDPITNSTVFLFISYILNIIYENKKVGKKEMAILSVLAVLVALFKIVYLPFIFLLVLLPKESFGGNKKKSIWISIVIILSIAISLIWLSTTSGYFESYYTNTPAQKDFIFSHLIEYCVIIVRTYCNYFVYLAQMAFAGVEMYNTQLEMYSIIPIIFIVISIIAALNETVKNKLKNWQKIYVVLILLGIIGLISTALYIQCTAQFIAIGNPEVGGLQGRYFIPIIIALILILGSRDKKLTEENKLLPYLIMAHIPVFLTMLVRFIV